MGDVILVSHSLFLQGDKVHRRYRENLELCRIKKTGTAQYTYSAKQGGSPTCESGAVFATVCLSFLCTAGC